MYTGRVACCLIVSHGKYADGRRYRQTDERQTVTLCFPLDAASVKKRSITNSSDLKSRFVETTRLKSM